MEIKTEKKPALKTAMEYGSYLGLFFIAKLVVSVLSSKLVFLGIIALAMTILVPVILYKLVLRFSSTLPRENLRFSSLWSFGAMTFIFASVLSGLAYYLFFQYIDPGFIQEQVNALQTIMNSLDSSKTGLQAAEVEKAFEQMGTPSPIQMAVQMIWANIFIGALLSLIIAPIVLNRKKTN